MDVKDILRQKGVAFPDFGSVYVGPEVDPQRIAGEGVIIHPGCRVSGAETLILAGAELGAEGPATVRDCAVGPRAKLLSGSFSGAVFLEGASAGPAAHVRPGTILEEGASAAHASGLKHTILFPFVTLGSLVNFCDCLMAGGTGPRDHSEVGSSYIHFNFTPQGDKATASLLGDVPRGVMLRERPIFLGGQGGLVGPAKIAYGSVLAAGSVWRRDICEENRLWTAGRPGRDAGLPFVPGLYRSPARVVRANVHYMASLAALMAWHHFARGLFLRQGLDRALLTALVTTVRLGLSERLKRMNEVAQKMPASAQLLQNQDEPPANLLAQTREIAEKWRQAAGALRETAGDPDRFAPPPAFLEALARARDRNGGGYVEAVKSLSSEDAATGSAWLSAIVSAASDAALSRLPLLR